MGTGKGGLYSHTKGASGKASCGGRIKATQFLPGKLDEHYEDHEEDFHDVHSPEEYEEKARKFFDKPVTKDLLWFEDVDGFLYKYDKKSHEFGICGPEGAMITYFKPERSTYWQDEVMKHYGA